MHSFFYYNRKLKSHLWKKDLFLPSPGQLMKEDLHRLSITAHKSYFRVGRTSNLHMCCEVKQWHLQMAIWTISFKEIFSNSFIIKRCKRAFTNFFGGEFLYKFYRSLVIFIRLQSFYLYDFSLHSLIRTEPNLTTLDLLLILSLIPCPFIVSTLKMACVLLLGTSRFYSHLKFLISLIQIASCIHQNFTHNKLNGSDLAVHPNATLILDLAFAIVPLSTRDFFGSLWRKI